jgi:hypothetical protein
MTLTGCPLRTNLYSVAVRIDYNALVVAIASASRAIDNRDSVVSETVREFIDKTLRTYRNRQMGQPKALCSRR